MADGRLFQSATFKVLGIGFLALLLLIPLALVNGLIQERSALKAEATARIAERWGGVHSRETPVPWTSSYRRSALRLRNSSASPPGQRTTRRSISLLSPRPKWIHLLDCER